MVLPRWLRKGFAILRVVLYSGDVVSDFWVGIDLAIRCHFKFAVSVFTYILLPGLIRGWLRFNILVKKRETDKEANRFESDIPIPSKKKLVLEALFAPISIIPITFWKLAKSAYNIDDKDAKIQANE